MPKTGIDGDNQRTSSQPLAGPQARYRKERLGEINMKKKDHLSLYLLMIGGMMGICRTTNARWKKPTSAAPVNA
jgi:hypothetical protein